MNRRTFVIGGAALLGGAMIHQNRRTWFIGDSFTVGWGADTVEGTWVNQLTRTLSLDTINLGISGSLCEEQVRCSIPYVPMWGKPSDLVVWMTGYNDVSDTVYREQFLLGLAALQGFPVLVAHAPPHPYRNLVQPVPSSWECTCPDIPRTSDGHPSQKGHDAIADFIASVLTVTYSVTLPEIR